MHLHCILQPVAALDLLCHHFEHQYSWCHCCSTCYESHKSVEKLNVWANLYAFLVTFRSVFFCEGRGDVTAFSPLRGRRGYWDKIQLTMGEGHPGWVASSMDGVPTAHQEQFWGSVSCSRILQHAAQLHPRGAGIWTSDLPITSSTHWATAAPIFWYWKKKKKNEQTTE